MTTHKTLKPFHSNLGAVGYLERNAVGPCSVFVVAPLKLSSGLKLMNVAVTYLVDGSISRYPGDQGWFVGRTRVVGPWSAR